MSVATVKTVAERFIRNPKPEVLALKGAWGVGKTYTWNQIVKSNKDQSGLEYYSYISLFGVSSISQLALSIFTTSRNIKLVGTKLDFTSLNKEWLALGKSGFKSLTNFVKKLDLPYSKNLSVGLDQLAPALIGNTIICLDDFERSQIKPEEIMGFISYLKEEKDCKVVLIFNQGELKEKEETYNKYREKVIDIELLFSPSPSEAIGLAFPQDMPHRELAAQCAMALKIVNIRLLMKISELWTTLLKPALDKMHPDVLRQAVMTLVLLAWAYYDRNENKPNFDFILKWERFTWHLNEKDKDNIDPKTKNWAAILTNYGLSHIDEFDYAISRVIEYGHIEETCLIEEAAKLNDHFIAIDQDKSFTEAWSFFHNFFSDNSGELIDALRDSFKKSYLQISPNNLNATVRLMRQLGRDDIANEMIEHYIEKRGNNYALFDLENQPFSENVDDTILRERFKEACTKGRQLPTLLDSVLAIAKQHGWSQEQILAVEQATEDDFYNLFLQNQGDQLTTVVRACLQFQTIGGRQHLAEKPRAALERLGRQSKLNELRVRKFGLTINPPQKPE